MEVDDGNDGHLRTTEAEAISASEQDDIYLLRGTKVKLCLYKNL